MAEISDVMKRKYLLREDIMGVATEAQVGDQCEQQCGNYYTHFERSPEILVLNTIGYP